MRLKRFTCRLGLCLMMLWALGLFGCVRSIHPILKDEQVTQSKSLAGVWKNADDESTSNFYRLIPESEMPATRPSAQFPEFYPGSGRYSAPKGGYVVLQQQEEAEASPSVKLMYLRVGKIGTMTIAEFTSPLDQPFDQGEDLGLAGLKFLPLYTFGRLDLAAEDHLTLTFADPGWFAKYLAEHPDELEALPGDPWDVILSAKTDDIQAFLIKHAKEKEFWTGLTIDFVRSSNPATQPTAEDTQPVGASTRSAK